MSIPHISRIPDLRKVKITGTNERKNIETASPETSETSHKYFEHYVATLTSPIQIEVVSEKDTPMDTLYRYMVLGYHAGNAMNDISGSISFIDDLFSFKKEESQMFLPESEKFLNDAMSYLSIDRAQRIRQINMNIYGQLMIERKFPLRYAYYDLGRTLAQLNAGVNGSPDGPDDIILHLPVLFSSYSRFALYDRTYSIAVEIKELITDYCLTKNTGGFTAFFNRYFNIMHGIDPNI
jgi:hypothetical protein